MKVCISVGHSPEEQGAVNQTFALTEYAYNNELAYLISKELHKLGHEVSLVRRKSLKELPKQINATGADVAVELHCNAFNKLVSGTEMLYHPTSTKGELLADFIQSAILDVLDLRDRGIVPSERELILKKTTMPCVIVESGFIDNDVDCMVLMDKKKELALAIASGIHEYSMSR